MRKIGIYGGTFDPPHIGHLHVAMESVRLLELDRLLIIPNFTPPHKARAVNGADPHQRLELLLTAFADHPKICVSDIELKREGESYTYETLEALREQHPEDEFVLLMGSDMFRTLRQWKYPERILAQASVGVFCRGDRGETAAIEKEKEILEQQGHTAYVLDAPAVQISSSDLRRMLVFGCGDSFLPEGVAEKIRQLGLYGTGRDYRGLSMDALEQTVVSLLKKNRVAHVLGCRDAAVSLAKHWGADETDAARAGLLHDVTKALDGPLQLTLCAEYGTMLSAFSRAYPKTLHALTGALVAERVFGENEAVVTAIRHHTTGRANMSLLEKIIYVADYMEPNRDFPGVETLRELAYSNIDAALKLGLELTLVHLKGQGAEVSPESAEALAWLNRTEDGKG